MISDDDDYEYSPLPRLIKKRPGTRTKISITSTSIEKVYDEYDEYDDDYEYSPLPRLIKKRPNTPSTQIRIDVSSDRKKPSHPLL